MNDRRLMTPGTTPRAARDQPALGKAWNAFTES